MDSLSAYPSLICKHWLRGLCKKGNTCEFLHEYNLRGMPECTHFARSGVCPNGSECLYLHLDAAVKRPSCPHYDRGFCPLGRDCRDKHVTRKALCRFYMAGFCPNGRACAEGAHPVWREKEELKRPERKVVLSPEEQEREKERLLALLEREREEEAREFGERGYGQQRLQGGRGRGRKNWRGQQRQGRY